MLKTRLPYAMTEQPRLLVSRRRHSEFEAAQVISTTHGQPKAKKSRSHYSQRGKSTSEKPTSLENLTPDLFCHVLDFLGATSKSLIYLSLANKHFQKTMLTIGDAMLPRALSHFRKPLAPKSGIESSTSLFIRHARICARVLSDLSHLRSVLGKAPESIQGNDVQTALNIALDLLEIVPAFSEPLDKQILATCGKCGGKAFKHSKRMLRGNEAIISLSSRRHHEDLLETSRLIMQAVVFRDLQVSKQVPLSLHNFVQKQVEAKQLQDTGCIH